VNLLAEKFPCFRDEGTFERKKVRFLKRAQIFVADLWAAFDGEGYGEFNDIDKITMFAGMSHLISYQPHVLTRWSRLPHTADAPLPWRNMVLPTPRKQDPTS
jgi:hypothetical protein